MTKLLVTYMRVASTFQNASACAKSGDKPWSTFARIQQAVDEA
jgi:hypothetical protein